LSCTHTHTSEIEKSVGVTHDKHIYHSNKICRFFFSFFLQSKNEEKQAGYIADVCFSRSLSRERKGERANLFINLCGCMVKKQHRVI
jgi:hypothetical protein